MHLIYIHLTDNIKRFNIVIGCLALFRVGSDYILSQDYVTRNNSPANQHLVDELHSLILQLKKFKEADMHSNKNKNFFNKS